MGLNLLGLLKNPLFFLFLTLASGLLIGKVKFKNISLGISGCLFTGIVLSILALKMGWIDQPKGLISPEIVNLSLLMFITSLGLSASKNLKQVFKKYGIKIVFLTLFLMFTAVAVTVTSCKLLNVKKHQRAGLYVGSLTSSPGLAIALENFTKLGLEDQVCLTYALSYIPGLLAVVFTVYLAPRFLKINLELESKRFKTKVNSQTQKAEFDFLAYAVMMVVTLIFSQFNFYLGKLGAINLGLSGSGLSTGLFLGSIKSRRLNFKFNPKIIGFLRKSGLMIFLSSVGLKYGGLFSQLTLSQSLGIFTHSLLVALTTIFATVIVGHFILRLNWIVLVGIVCGGMTSTPGIGAAIESTQSEEVVTSYSAVYPVALIAIMFTLLFF